MALRSISAAQLRERLVGTPLTTPVYADLAERVRLLVVDGRLGGGVRLPSERELAESLSLSRSTIAAAYEALRTAGYLQARRGAGNFATIPHARVVSTHLPGPLGEEDGSIGMTCASGSAPAGLAAAYAGAAARLPELLASTGYLPDGLLDLRVALAGWFTARGLPTDPGQLVVTNGALSALNVVARCLLVPGDRVLAETPTYSNAIEALRAQPIRLAGYPLPASGWDPVELEQTLGQVRPALSYLVPDFHNPTGAWMSEELRPQVAGAVRRAGSRLLVDETLVELALDGGAPRTPLAAYAPGAVTIGSASKAFWSGLRIGWIRAPHDLVRPLIETRAAMDLGAAPFEQLVVAGLLTDGAHVLAEQRTRLRRQRDHLAGRLRATFPTWTFTVPAGGLTLWVQLPDEASSRLAGLAHDHGVLVTPGPRFHVDGGGERHLRLPFTAGEAVLTEAVRRLEHAWADVQTRRPGGVRRRSDPLALSA